MSNEVKEGKWTKIAGICAVIALVVAISGFTLKDFLFRTQKERTQTASETVNSGNSIPGTSIKVGDCMKIGKYPQGGTLNEPLEWIVLSAEDDRALVMSKYGIDCKKYNEVRKDITWENCTLRKWLNSDFINKAFTTDEKKKILSVTVKNPKTNGTEGGNDTNDKVFLLSKDEYYEYVYKTVNAHCYYTDYALKNGIVAQVGENGKIGRWWLRSPGSNGQYASGVFYDGDVDNKDYYYVDFNEIAVRPAMYIDLKN